MLTTFAKITQLLLNRLGYEIFSNSHLPSFSTVRSKPLGTSSSYHGQATALSTPASSLFFFLFNGESALLGIMWILGPTTSLGSVCMLYGSFSLSSCYSHWGFSTRPFASALNTPAPQAFVALMPSLNFPPHGSFLKELSAPQCTLSASSLLVLLTQSLLLSASVYPPELPLPSSQMASMLPNPFLCVLFLYFKKLLFVELNRPAKICCYPGNFTLKKKKNTKLLKPFLLRYNPHTIIFIYLKHTVQLFLVCSQNWATITTT